MKTMKRVVVFGSALAMIAALFSLAACGDAGGGPGSPPPPPVLTQSATPTADTAVVAKTSATQASVAFTLTSSNTGTWKAYDAETGGTALAGVNATFAASTLTLASTGNDLAAGVYYVSVTETGKSESGRLALLVEADSPSTLTGSLSIDGTAQVGETLSANTSSLTGYTGPLFYQWKAGTDPVGANAAAYIPAVADIGKAITVTVSAAAGNATSAATTTVPVSPAIVPASDLAAYLPKITTHSAASPATVTLAAVNISEVWGDINSAVLTAQKYVELDLSACSATGNAISGANGNASGNDMNVIKDNTYIKGIVLPSSLKTIGGYAFLICLHLTSISIPEGVTTIGNDAFCYCFGLTSATIPSGVTSIGDRAFFNCTSLTSVSISDSVTSIGYNAFYDCNSLTSIAVDNGNPNYSSDDGVLFNNDQTTLIQYPQGKSGSSYSIPSSVTTIGNYAFSKCTSLTSVTIPEGVITIEHSAFISSNGLTGISIPATVTSIGPGAFDYCDSLAAISVDASNNYYSDNGGVLFNKDQTTLVTYPGGKSGSSYTIPDGVTTIGSRAFHYCTSLTSVTIPASVTSIGERAFASCSGLASVNIPSGVTTIENYAFYGCSGLTSISIPSGVTTIENYAFAGCSGLTSVTIPGTVTTIGYYAFAGCTSLTSVTFEDSIAAANFSATSPFYGNLRAVYLGVGGGPGTYTTPGPTVNNSAVWTKQ